MRHIKYKTRNQNYRIRLMNKRHGFTIVELLSALAIACILLAAVAAAFNASVTNYRENENMFRAINSARQALFRMTSQLRTADAVEPNSPANECTLITCDGEDITYRYNADNKLYLITNDDLTDPDYELCENVNAMTFTRDVIIEGTEIKVKSVQISITVARGNTQKKVSAAAVIRRNLSL